MKPIGDLSFPDTSTPESDPTTSFEKLWREVEEREKREGNADLAHHRVRLACSGELVDIGSVGLVVSRESALGVVLIEFVCSRCDELHESRLFP
jgi:hypothetical protein